MMMIHNRNQSVRSFGDINDQKKGLSFIFASQTDSKKKLTTIKATTIEWAKPLGQF